MPVIFPPGTDGTTTPQTASTRLLHPIDPRTDVAISAKLLKTFRVEARRSGVSAFRLLKMSVPMPKGLSWHLMKAWIDDDVSVAKREHVEFILARWAALPDDPGLTVEAATSPSRAGPRAATTEGAIVPMTEEMAAWLRLAFARTGLDANTVLTKATEPPERLTARVIRSWLYREAKTVDAALWGFLVDWLQAQPDRGPPAPGPIKRPRKPKSKSRLK